MKTTPTLLAAVILGAGLSTTTANAALAPALGGQVVNDTDLNITWLANANLAATNTFGVSGINPDGSMTWSTALQWIAGMNAANYLGYNDWRLPTSQIVDPSCSFQSDGGLWGIQSVGYNCTGSDMGHLFYNELGGVAQQNITTTHNANYGLFQNVQSYYWTDQWYNPLPDESWTFSFSGGTQGHFYAGFNMSALAVRAGQVATVPVPATVWLLGSGLLGMAGVSRKRKAA